MRTFTQKLAFSLVVLLCYIGLPINAADLTVANGIETNEHYPFYGYYADQAGTHVQCLYPASMLSSMNDGVISQMTFYVNDTTTALNYGGAVFNVSLGETDDPELSGTFISNGLTQVYSGHINFKKQLVVEFDNSYDYSGKNLVIDFYIEKGGSCPHAYFYGVTDYTSAGHYVTGNGSESGVGDFLPKVTFGYVPAVQSCGKPATLEVSNIMAHGATIAWTQGSGTYNVQYKAATETEWTTALSNTMQNSAQLTNLMPNTMYQARVQSICLDTVSIWKTIGFKTGIGVPYAESYDNSYAPEGWNLYDGGLDTIMDGKPFESWTKVNQYWEFGQKNGVFDSHAHVELRNRTAAWLVSPSITLESDMQLSFDLALTKYSTDDVPEPPTPSQQGVRFVVLASANGGTTWNILRTWDNVGSAYVFNNINHSALGEEFAIDLSSYDNKSIQIAFYAEHPVSDNSINEIHIDNVHINEAPACLKPTKLAASNIAKHSVLLSWQANTGESAWNLQYKKSSESAWQSIDVNTNPYELSGLEQYTDYEVRIAADCSASSNGVSLYSKPCSFKTAIGIAYEETFNTSLPSDWTKYKGSLKPILDQEATLIEDPNSIYGWKVGAGYGAFGTSKHLNLNIAGTGCEYWLVSPAIELDKDQVQLSFDLSLTKANGVLQHVVPGEQNDDKFAVLITTDDGESWQTLRLWDNDESAYVYDNIKCTQEGQKVVINLSDYASDPATKKVRIAFYGESTEGQSTGAGSNYIHIANVLIDSISACPNPTNLEASGIFASEATLSWDEAEGNASWAYGYVANPANDFVPQDADFADTVEVASVVISALQENTPYIFFVRRACGDGHSDYLTCRFRTGQLPVDISSTYSDDFESGDNWYPINGVLTNAWVYGTAAHAGQNGHAIYISNDGGTTNAYTVNKLGVVYAQKLFNFSTSGLYAFKYDWKAKGQVTTYNHSANDYLRVALVPSSVELEASTNLPSGFSYNALPEGWIALDGGTYLANVADWQNMEADVQVPAGEYKVVFVWRNDGSSGTQTPAAIDNFSIARITCVKPVGPAISSVTASSAAARWISGGEGQNAWQIALDTVAGSDPDTLSSLIDVTANSYTLENLEEKTTYYAYVRANCGSEDGYSDWVAFNSFTTFANCQLPDALATGEPTDSSVIISWNKYWADDFNLRYSVDGGANWTIVENVNTPYMLKGLAENTDYRIQVQATCHTADEWSESVNIHTKQRPFVLSGNYSDDFEDGNKWYFINGTCANVWSYGVAANNGGSHAIYISNDGGATNKYGSGATMVYATKSFIFEGGSYTFSYDWNANGQASNDYLRVALVPGTVTINASTMTPPNFSATGLPTGWIALDGGGKLNLASSWQTYETAEIAIAAGEYRVVFAWRNDNYTFNQTPAAVDNFRISKLACSKPSALNVTLTQGNGSIATLNWTAGASETDWVVEYSTVDDFSDAISLNISTDPIANLTGLTPETEYYARVKAVCGGENGESDWSKSVKLIPTNSYMITINEGTATNDYVPFYAYYAQNLTRSQFIIQEIDLSAIKGDTIKQLTFYCNKESHDFGNARFDIYMAAEDEITVSSISELSDWDALTKVKAGCGLSISDNQMTIRFDEPFEYPGGTLTVGFNQTTQGTRTDYSFSWYGVSVDGAAYGGYGTSISQRNFAPKMTISYAPHQKISTGINSAASADKPLKFIRNRQVYILVNGVVYDTMGRKVEVKK